MKITYILLEYIKEGTLYDICKQLRGMGEDVGRFYLT